MTTTAVPGLGEDVFSVLRTPDIATDLLPPEIIAARRGRGTRRRVAAAMVSFALLLGGWYAFEAHQTSGAQADLEAAQQDVQRLRTQQRQFATLVATQSELKVIGTRLSTLLAGDLQWGRVLTYLRKAAPAKVSINGVSASLSSSTSQSTDDNSLPQATDEKIIGTVSVTGYADKNASVAQYVDALAQVPGLGAPLLTDATREDGRVRFTVRADLTDALLGGRFTESTNSTTTQTASTQQTGGS